MRKLFENAFTGLAICSFILAGIINIESQMGENVMFIAIAVAIIDQIIAFLDIFFGSTCFPSSSSRFFQRITP